jgi:hypothetical protein
MHKIVGKIIIKLVIYGPILEIPKYNITVFF